MRRASCAIGGDVTEIVYALGAGDRIVGVDTTSQFPPQALKEKKSVGYMRALSSEGVISVGATLVLASERSGPPEVVKTLKATSVPYVEIADQNSQEGIVGKIRLIAQAVAPRQRARARREGGGGLQGAGGGQRQDQAAGARAVRARRAERARDGGRAEHQRRCDPEARRRDQRGGGGDRLPPGGRRGDRRAGAGCRSSPCAAPATRTPTTSRSCSPSRACSRPPPARPSASSAWTGCICWASARARPRPRAI